MKITKKIATAALLSSLLLLSACGDNASDNNTTQQSSTQEVNEAQKRAFLTTYADIALAVYTDSLEDAKALQKALETFTTTPTDANLQKAKEAWIASRESYLQSEIFRLSNTPIDAEEGWVHTTYGAPEGEMNAWPLDEGLIDYYEDVNGTKTSGNIIDARLQTSEVNISKPITAEMLVKLNELNGNESNVATGYHAIEFLLWGQDQDYKNGTSVDAVTNGAKTAGERPLSDYTTDENRERRKEYLLAVSAKLVEDLETVQRAWLKDVNGSDGAYRAAFLNQHTNKAYNLTTKEALAQTFDGIGTYMITEMSADRISAGLNGPNEEEEHSCFSDNTHRDIYQDFQGFENIVNGSYKDIQGTGLKDLLSSEEQRKLQAKMDEVKAKLGIMDDMAKALLSEGGMHYDYQLRPGKSADNIRAISFGFNDLGNFMPKYKATLAQ